MGSNGVPIALCLEYSISQHGGTEVLVRDLVKGLSREFSIVLVSMDKSGEVLNGSLATSLSDHVEWSGQRAGPSESKSLALALQKKGVRLAHFHFGGIYAFGSRTARNCPVYYCGRLRLPSLITTHLAFSVLDYCGPQRSLWYKLGLLPWPWLNRMLILGLVYGEVAVSKHDLEVMQHAFFPLRKKLRQMYHATTRPKLSASVENRELFILQVGTFTWRKGQVDLVKAFGALAPRFPEWKLVLVGRMADKDYTEQVKAEIVRRGIEGRVTLTGEMNQSDGYELMAKAAILAMPSYLEGLPLSLQEALSYGCPAIAYASGGIPELIDHEGNGLLVPPGDLTVLEAGLERLMADPALRERFAVEAKASILRKQMTVEAMVEGYSKIYRQMVSTTPAAARHPG
ncbi:MAG TPA: glycosyltransferase family 4 protein [Chthoniobacterales bacterium]